MTSPYSHILRSAADIADERTAQYGEATKNFTEIQKLIEDMGLSISLPEICLVMIGTKLARERHQHKPDNLLDIINYTAMMLHFKQNAQPVEGS